MAKERVLLWGGGYLSRYVYDVIDKEKIEVIGLVDKDTSKIKFVNNDVKIFQLQQICELSYDYILITASNYDGILSQACSMGIDSKKVYAYWNMKIDIPFIPNREEKYIDLAIRNTHLEMLVDSIQYELEQKDIPIILSGEELLRKIISEHTSLSRFGDGEFEIMRGNNRPWFQEYDAELSSRLKEIVKTNDKRVSIAIANNFYNLSRMNQSSAEDCRIYMSNGTRQAILSLIDLKKTYYDTYVTRPYIIYPDRNNADILFPLFKEIWRNREILIVEGEFSRFGINNDLLEGAKSIKRIICPKKNAWKKYKDILKLVKSNVNKETLVLISLGPTASVLAYDLGIEDIQAIDIGQLDNEYEWYLAGATKRFDIPGKITAEVFDDMGKIITDNIEIDSKEYYAQICAQIM